MKKISYFITLVILVSSACHAPKDLIYVGVQNFNIGKAGLKQTVLSMDVQLYNPNNYRLKLKHADMDLFINNNRLGKINLNGKIPVPHLDTFLLPVTLDVDIAHALPNMLQLAFNSEVNVKLSGSVRAGRHGIFITVPVSYEGKQDIRSGLKW
jgi:LEA14-like dessication related protein